MNRKPELPSYRSPASGDRLGSGVVVPAERSHPSWEVPELARESRAAGLRRRLSQAGASTLKNTKQGISVSLVGGIKQIYTTWNESQRKSSVARLGQPS